jgi:murein DD-endopeptidase MepM/ murein hydrolase activator NlpD
MLGTGFMSHCKLNLQLILITVLILSGCSGGNHSKKLLSNIETHLSKEHKIEHGAVVATYDLVGLGSAKCLHAKDYSLIINDSHQNSRFISKASSKLKKHKLEQRAKAKLADLKSNLSRLHDKYKIFKGSDLRSLDFPESSESDSPFDSIDSDKEQDGHLSRLHKTDQLSKHVPIFFPHYSARLASSFGMRKHPIDGSKKLHAGTDFVGPKTSPVYAAADGRVLEVKKCKGYGNNLVIGHGKQFKTRYAHLSKILVKKGDHVIRGQRVGLQGKTGRATAEHLHFEVMLNETHVNPADFVMHGYSCQVR